VELQMAVRAYRKLLSPIAKLFRLGWATHTDVNDRMNLKEEIKNIIDVLSSPDSEGDMENGWNQRLRRKWTDRYEDLDKKIIEGGRLPQPMSAARAMDFDGVGDTVISHMAARIDNLINRGERY
jgi:hypothetical protein